MKQNETHKLVDNLLSRNVSGDFFTRNPQLYRAQETDVMHRRPPAIQRVLLCQ